MLRGVRKDNLYTQRSLRDRPRAQGHILSRLAFLKYLNYWKIAGLRPAIFSGTPGNFKDLIIVAQLHLGQGTISTRLPFHDRMVGVITLNLQKKCILVAKKGCNLQWQISYALLFFEKNFLFLDQFFLFFDLDCQNLTAFKNWSRKRKSFSQKRNCACELCHFSATLFQLLRRFISTSFWKNVWVILTTISKVIPCLKALL